MCFRQVVGLLAVGVLSAGSALATPSVTLAWNASGSGGVAGYRLYQGLVSHNYSSLTDLGLATNVTISGLAPGRTYYFAVTDYEIDGLESAFSGEVSYTVPVGGAILQLACANGQAVLSGTARAGYQYDVQASTQAVGGTNWVTIGSLSVGTNSAFRFLDPTVATNRCRVYRLRQTSP